MKTPEKHLYYLSKLSDYKISGGYPDVRNWEVKDKALRKIGAVKNLLVNTKTERVVYLDVEVDQSIIDANHDPYGRPAHEELREFINEKGENHIIIPIGLVDLNKEQEYVFAESIDHKTFAETKRFRRDAPIERDYENAVLDSYERRHVHAPLDHRVDSSDVENAKIDKKERMDHIKQRHHVGKYRDSETAPNNIEDEAQQYFDENESAEDHEKLKGEEFYGRSEFDDSRFYKGEK